MAITVQVPEYLDAVLSLYTEFRGHQVSLSADADGVYCTCAVYRGEELLKENPPLCVQVHRVVEGVGNEYLTHYVHTDTPWNKRECLSTGTGPEPVQTAAIIREELDLGIDWVTDDDFFILVGADLNRAT